MGKRLDWFDEHVTHLDVTIINLIVSVVMSICLIIGKRVWWIWFLLFVNIVSALLNGYLSWKKDEFNRRKWRKIN